MGVTATGQELAPLSLRPTAPHVAALDGVRAVAALMVVLTHVAFQTGETSVGTHGGLLARMDLGVAIFFVLSGFLLYRPWARATRGLGGRPGTRRYLWRRAVRIFPAYWVALVAVLLTVADAPLGDVVRHLSLTQLYGGTLLTGFTQTWSLATEASFYLVLPVLALALVKVRGPRHRLAVLAGMAAVAPLWTAAAAAGQLPELANTWLPAHLDWFAAGMALAVVLADVEARPTGRPAEIAADLGRHPGSLLAVAGAVFWFASTAVAGPRTLSVPSVGESVVKELTYAAVAILVVAAGALAAPGTWTARILGGDTAVLLGRVSYGVFLWHLVILHGIFSLFGLEVFQGSFVLVAVGTVAATLVVAWISWTVLERPLLRRASSPVSSDTSQSEGRAPV